MKVGANPFRVAECRRFGGGDRARAGLSLRFPPRRGNPGKRRPDADPSLRRAAHGDGNRDARARIHRAGAGTRGRDRADRRRRPRGRPRRLRSGWRSPTARCFGVEPFGADTMYRSFRRDRRRRSRRSTRSRTASARRTRCRFPMRSAARASTKSSGSEDEEMVAAMRFLLRARAARGRARGCRGDCRAPRPAAGAARRPPGRADRLRLEYRRRDLCPSDRRLKCRLARR